GARLGILKVPATVLVTSRSFWPVATFVTIIVVPEIAPPFWSTTVPVIAPVAPACASSPAGTRSANNTPTKTVIHFVILIALPKIGFSFCDEHIQVPSADRSICDLDFWQGDEYPEKFREPPLQWESRGAKRFPQIKFIRS